MYFFGFGNYIPLMVYSIGMIFVLVAIFYDNKIPFLFLISLLPLQNILETLKQFPLGKDFVDILLFGIVIGWIRRALLNREKVVEQTSFNFILMIFVIYTFISLWQGNLYIGSTILNIQDPRLQTWKNYMILPLIYFITVNNIKNRKWIVWYSVIMAFIVFIMGLQFFRNFRWVDTSFYREAMRSTGTFTYLGSNEYAAFYAHYLFIFLGLLIFSKYIGRRILLAATVLVSIYCVLFLYSRGAYLAVIAGLSFIGLLRVKKILILLVLCLIFWQTLLPISVVERVNSTKTEEGYLDNSNTMRLEMWKESMRLFENNPIAGVGFNVVAYKGFVLGDTHNIYVKVLAEQGIIGMIIFSFLIMLFLKEGWKLYSTTDDSWLKGLGLGFTTCVIVLIINNFFGDRWTYIPLSAFLWVFLGLVVRANIITQEEKLQENFK